MNSKASILLVDDEEEFVTTLAERLEIRGFQPEAATSGQQAVELMENRHFDVMVLDVKMPGMSGLKVMEKARELRPDLPIILLTGHGSTDDGVQGMHQGAFDFLMKPLDIDELISKISEAIAENS
ncbi:MAG: response regulator [Thermodesulfobacteriota bacterium]